MKELTTKLEQVANDTNFSGAISIFKDTFTIFDQAFGYRDIKNELPNTLNTIFGIASGTKLITALGIGCLIDQGLIGLETTVKEIDPNYTGFVDDEATIQHLLSHTSGIYDYYDEEIEQDWDNFAVDIPWNELETPSDYFPLFQDQTFKFQPGARFSYSNGGYVFLGILIEKLSSMLFRDFINKHVLKPAQMTNSGFFALNDLPANTANGYLEDRQTTNIYQLPLRGGGDGGMFTTSADIHALWEALFTYQIISKELTNTFLSTHSKINKTFGYGLGLYKLLDDSLYEFEGSDAGVGFYSSYRLHDKLNINIFSNITNGESDVRNVVMGLLS